MYDCAIGRDGIIVQLDCVKYLAESVPREMAATQMAGSVLGPRWSLSTGFTLQPLLTNTKSCGSRALTSF